MSTINFTIAPTLPYAVFGSLQTLVHDTAPRRGLVYSSFSTSEIAERLDEVHTEFEALLEGADEYGAYVHDADADESLTRGLALLRFVVEYYAPSFGTVPDSFRREPIAPVKVMTADGVTVARRTVLDEELIALVDEAADYMRAADDNGNTVIVDATRADEYFRDREYELGTFSHVRGNADWGGAQTMDIDTDSRLYEMFAFIDWERVAENEVETGSWTEITHEGVNYYVEQNY